MAEPVGNVLAEGIGFAGVGVTAGVTDGVGSAEGLGDTAGGGVGLTAGLEDAAGVGVAFGVTPDAFTVILADCVISCSFPGASFPSP